MLKRRVAVTLVVVAIGVGGSLLLQRTDASSGVPSIVRARAIELVDAGGNVRAQLNTERSGEVVLRLRDQNGTIRLKLGASTDGSALLMTDEATEVGVHMHAKRGGTSLTLKKGAQQHVIRL